MREDLLAALETEYQHLRENNERTEAARRERIRREYPDIENAVEEREELIRGTIRTILGGGGDAGDLTGIMEEKNRRIREMLRDSGLPEDYLAPVYRCSECRDTGYVGEPVRVRCACFLRAYQQRLRESIGLSGVQPETFETFDPGRIPEEMLNEIGRTQRDLTVSVCNRCRQWADQFPDVSRRNILLTGPSGVGKTFLLRSIADRLISRGQNVLLISAYRFIEIARKSYFEGDDGMNELLGVPVLILDDLGSEPMMKNITVEQLFYLVNERKNRKLSTLISTNLSLEELPARYTERIVSRINDPHDTMTITMFGRDLRTV